MRVRKISRSRVAPLHAALRAEGLGADLDDGEWLGASEGSKVIGVVRKTEREGHLVIDDLWVDPAERKHGIASALIAQAKARYRPLWLICDEDAVDFYVRRGFARKEIEEFPAPLGEMYAARGEWPQASDHAHVPMLWDPTAG